MIEENKELQRTPESEDTAAQVTPCEKKSTYCNTPMPVHARVCASCNRDQRWYLNYFRIGDLLLLVSILISFGMVLFSYWNFHESREERVKASDALQRASKAEDLVKQGEQQLKQLQVVTNEGRKEVVRITSLVKEAETKLTKVEDATKETRQRAADLSKQLDEYAKGERLARKKIEERLADRSLTDAQVRVIADKLKLFSGQEFGITTYWDLKEPLSMANRIYGALNLAGWKYLKPESATFLLGGVAGVLVYVHPAADELTKKAAASLVSALTKEGITLELREQNDPKNPNNRLYFNVGTKP